MSIYDAVDLRIKSLLMFKCVTEEDLVRKMNFTDKEYERYYSKTFDGLWNRIQLICISLNIGIYEFFNSSIFNVYNIDLFLK